MITNNIILEAYTMQDYVNTLRADIYKDPKTVYFGRILQNMNIIVINDVNPREVNYEVDEDGNWKDEYRHPLGLRIFGMTRPTMAVDLAGNLYIGESFILKEIYEKFPNNYEAADVVKAVLLHESMHISEMTFYRQQDRHPRIWNIATDAFINYTLIQNGYTLPNGIVPDKNGILTVNVMLPSGAIQVQYSLAGKSAEMIYDELIKILDLSDPAEDDDDGDPPPPKPIERGDPVYNPANGEYGVVLDPNKPETRIITREEAMIRAKLKNRGIVNI